jgi:hypothetical protein
MQSYSLNDDKRFQSMMASAIPHSIYLADYPNSDPKLYGFRQMVVQTQQGPRVDGQKQTEQERRNGIAMTFLNEKRRVLLESNRDNVVFESGSMRLRGNEKIKAGMIVNLSRGNQAASEYYAVGVTHNFSPFQSYVTVIEFERGAGFIKRIQDNGGAGGGPYLSELSLGGLYE